MNSDGANLLLNNLPKLKAVDLGKQQFYLEENNISVLVIDKMNEHLTRLAIGTDGLIKVQIDSVAAILSR
jgi:hypothetical protein